MATIIKIRRGINGFKYAACDMDGNFIGNLNSLSEAIQYWKKGNKDWKRPPYQGTFTLSGN